MTTLALTGPMWNEILAALANHAETAGVVAARAVDGPDGVTLLGRRITWASDEAYLERTSRGLSLRSTGWVPAARAAAADASTYVFVHTHPGGDAAFSERDDIVDAALDRAASSLGAAGPYASLVVAGAPDRETVTARIFTAGEPTPMRKIRIVDDRLRMFTGASELTDAGTFDRQMRLFGEAGQGLLRSLHAGVVGTGGTGSAAAEQLARLGVGTITLIDDDVITDPTPTRGYGTTVADVHQPKAAVVAEHLRRIGLGTTVRHVVGGVHDADALLALRSADVVFCCVDGHGARLVLNRWAYAHLAPVIDLAVLAAPGTDAGAQIDGRVTWIAPTTACLLCRGRLDPAAAYAELLHPEERHRLAGEGYVPEADTTQPAVVTLTSYVASLATSEMLLRLFGLAPADATEIIARIPQRELSRNRLPPRPGCICSDPGFVGRGVEDPYLDLVWPS
jgi:molybdopterin/thiamine biosynthesis adenylyltransferase